MTFQGRQSIGSPRATSPSWPRALTLLRIPQTIRADSFGADPVVLVVVDDLHALGEYLGRQPVFAHWKVIFTERW